MIVLDFVKCVVVNMHRKFRQAQFWWLCIWNKVQGCKIAPKVLLPRIWNLGLTGILIPSPASPHY